jgi:hypothetical protein
VDESDRLATERIVVDTTDMEGALVNFLTEQGERLHSPVKLGFVADEETASVPATIDMSPDRRQAATELRRFLRAIGMAVLVMATIVLCGMLEVGKLAVREATIAFRAQLGMTVAKSNAADEGKQLGEEALISRQTGVRLLRQVATQRGIRNAGRMRKPELLAVLELG